MLRESWVSGKGWRKELPQFVVQLRKALFNRDLTVVFKLMGECCKFQKNYR